MKWGQVPRSDYELTTYELDTLANAVILGDYGKITTFRGNSSYEQRYFHHRRVKILSKKGLEHSNVQVFFRLDGKEQVRDIKAHTIKKNGQVKELSKKEVFKVDYNEYWGAMQFSIPGVEPGDIIEYKYNIFSESIFELKPWYFQDELPVRSSRFVVENNIPASYVSIFEGGDAMKRENLKDGTSILSLYDMKIVLGANGVYEANNCPAIKDEDSFVTTTENYKSRVRFQLTEHAFRGVKQKVLSTWDALAKDLLRETYFGDIFNKKKAGKKLLKVLEPELSGNLSELEKMEVIFRHLATKMQWNGRYGWTTSNHVDDLYEVRTGTAGELNLMLLALLKKIGIKAYPILISTRHHGKTIEKYPLVDQFNHVIVGAEVEGQIYYLDVFSSVQPMGLIPTNSLNYRGWKVDKDKPVWVDIPAENSRRYYVIEVELNQGYNLVGDVRKRTSHYFAFDNRRKYKEFGEEEYKEKILSSPFSKLKIDSLQFEKFSSPNKPLNTRFNIEASDLVQSAGGYLYIQPIIYPHFSENPFKAGKRYYPVELPFPWAEQYVINIKIPEGYSIEELPESASIVLPDKSASYKLAIEELHGKVQLVSTFKIGRTKYLPEEYKSLKMLFDLMLEKMGEQIVLIKTEN